MAGRHTLLLSRGVSARLKAGSVAEKISIATANSPRFGRLSAGFVSAAGSV
jgi:hypothetical protein